MNVPKEKKLYCVKCKKHTSHKLKEFKSGKGRPMAAGVRRHEENTRGYMGKYKHIIKVKKQNKTPAFLIECGECKKKSSYSLGKRMKKVDQQ